MSDFDLAAQELVLLRASDLQACAENPLSFIERHCKIETPTGAVIPFCLWKFQAATVRTIHESNVTIALKARRMGLSWIALAYALHLAIFQQGSRILMLCKRLDDSKEMVGRIRRMLIRIEEDPASRHLLAGLKIGRDSVDTLEIGNSVFRALPATERSARQETAALLIGDEFAFVDNAAKIIRAAIPTIEGGGKAVFISTGNGSVGRGAEFASQWERATSGESGWIPLFWPWDARPDRDAEWKDRTVNILGEEERFKVEYPETPEDAFLSPDTTLVYPGSGISAAERLGKEFEELRKKGQLAPVGSVTHLGIDWGEQTHAVLGWELEGGGLYIPPKEIVQSGGEPTESSRKMLQAVKALGHPLGKARYDAAGIQSMRTFKATIPGTKTVKVPFGKYKTETIHYLRHLFARAAAGHHTRIIAIHPSNEQLLRQLRSLEFEDADQGKIDKGDDHGPDALAALAAPLAAKARKRANQLTD